MRYSKDFLTFLLSFSKNPKISRLFMKNLETLNACSNSADFMTSLENGEIDFIDVGCGTGGSLKYCQKVFGLHKGIGFDFDERKILVAQSKGYRVYLQDILKVNFPAKCVSYTSMMDFLEHLPDMGLAEKMIFTLAYASKDFLFIRHPNFDDIDYLRGFNLKLTWTDWTGHKNMMKISDFMRIFNEFKWNEYKIIPRKLIRDSRHEAILPVSASKNIIRFSQVTGLKKPSVIFDKPIYSQYDIFVKLNEFMSKQKWDEITSKTGEGC